uniref:Activin_recp domain-containing protein n=1 Tax=Thelazia callipaeda TaxID=103827 RepID=A0A0N5D5G5_THECL
LQDNIRKWFFKLNFNTFLISKELGKHLNNCVNFHQRILLLANLITLSEELFCYSGVRTKISLERCDNDTKFCYKQRTPNNIGIVGCDHSTLGLCRKYKREECLESSTQGEVCCCRTSKCNGVEQQYSQSFHLIALLILITAGNYFLNFVFN